MLLNIHVICAEEQIVKNSDWKSRIWELMEQSSMRPSYLVLKSKIKVRYRCVVFLLTNPVLDLVMVIQIHCTCSLNVHGNWNKKSKKKKNIEPTTEPQPQGVWKWLFQNKLHVDKIWNVCLNGTKIKNQLWFAICVILLQTWFVLQS